MSATSSPLPSWPTRPDATAPIPVCIFTGFLGAGKTTVLQRVVSAFPTSERVLVIVNDFSEDNTDVHAFAPAVCPGQSSEAPGASGRTATDGVVPLSGGCLCCNLLHNLVVELEAAAASAVYTYVLVECTGLADPAPIAATLTYLPRLRGKVVVDAVVTVVDAPVVHRSESIAASTPLATEQLRGANIILVNKWELVKGTPEDRARAARDVCERVKAFAAEANPSVRVMLTRGGMFPFWNMVPGRRLLEADHTGSYYLRLLAERNDAVREDLGSEAARHRAVTEEAREMAKLGAVSLTVTSASTPLISHVVAAMRSQGGRLLEGVWRSKGFFYAVDDVGPRPSSHTSGDCRPATATQFRWNSVGRRFDYGEVLPPHVPLGAGHSDAPEGRHGPVHCRLVFIGTFDRARKAQAVTDFLSAAASDRLSI